MRTVLVSGASGIVGYGILRSLKRSGLNLRLVGTTIYGDSVAEGFCDILELAPPTEDIRYLDWLLTVISNHNVDLLIPGIEADVYKWAEHRTEIESGGKAVVMLNQPELISLCRDKWVFYEHFKTTSSPSVIKTSLSPNFAALADEFGVPFLLKPRIGFGSKGIVKVESWLTFQKHQSDIGPVLMAQPIMGNEDEELTASAFCDGRGGFYAQSTLRRRLANDGFTNRAEVVPLSESHDTLLSLCNFFKPVGPTNFQFRKHGGVLKLLEINPRISSATSIRTAFGYNECQMAVEYFLEKVEPFQPVIKQGRAVRYTEDFIFYS